MRKREIAKILEFIEEDLCVCMGISASIVGTKSWDYRLTMRALYADDRSNPFRGIPYYLGGYYDSWGFLQKATNIDLRATAFLFMLAYLGEL